MDDGKAFLRIVRGDPSAEEVAALVAVLTARAQAAASARRDGASGGAPASRWADRSRLTRTPVPARPGPGAWRASALPR